MLSRLTRLLLAASRSWWLCGLIFVLNFLSFRILFGLEDRFEALTNLPVFDTQNSLTSEALVQQLPLYTGAAYVAYLRFAAFDFVFPLIAALFLAVVWAVLLRLQSGRVAQRLLGSNLPLLPFCATIFDWLENISLLAVTGATSPPGYLLLSSVILFKRLKLASLALIWVVTLLLLVLLAAHRSAAYWRKYTKRFAAR
jgi:hypothetical protein